MFLIIYPTIQSSQESKNKPSSDGLAELTIGFLSTVKVGDLADEVWPKLNGLETVGTEAVKDPANSNSLQITHHYIVNDKRYALIFTRFEDPGPYRLREIREE